jgi:stearoyl-CoA desaturase (delta-9 desaturase)
MSGSSSLPRPVLPLLRWLDSWAGQDSRENLPQKVDWVRVLPFIAVHVACLAVFLVGWSWVAVGVAAALYFIRMFFITGFYHRYFSHRAFDTSRGGQLALAIAGGTCMQRGPLWWAAHHREHHRHSDGPEDIHSPRHHGFLWSHIGWVTSKANFPTKLGVVPDLAKYPELVFLDRFDTLIPFAFAFALFGLGALLHAVAPGLGTTGWQMLVWGFFVSTVVHLHASVTINSVAHVFGRRRYKTTDDSKNSFLLALVTLGEGWHNNHHYFPGSARNGFRWWEIDVTYYTLKALSWTGLIWNLRPVPERVLAGRAADGESALA